MINLTGVLLQVMGVFLVPISILVPMSSMCDDIDGKLKLIIASELYVLYSILIISLTVLAILAL